MYFDNYLNPKPPSYNFNYPTSSPLQFNQPVLQNTQPPSQNAKPIFQPRLAENSSIFKFQFNKNQPIQTANYRPFINQQSSSISNPIIDQNGPSKSVNPSFLIAQSSNLTQIQEKKESLKRKDSNSISNYFKQNQAQSPTFHGNFIQQNKNPIKTNYPQQSHHNMHSMGRPTLSTNNLGNFDFNSLKDPHRSAIVQTHPQKDFRYQKVEDKSLTFQNMGSSQLKFDQSKQNQKPYALDFRSKNETGDFETKKNKTVIDYEEKQKKLETENKNLTYNFQLKNTASDWSMFSKPTQQGRQSKFYTPSNIKKQSFNEPTNEIKKDFNQVNDYKENKNTYLKTINQTDRQVGKSPSIDTLLNNAYYRERQYKKISQTSVPENSSNNNQNIQNQSQPKNQQSNIDQKLDKKPGYGKNYQALIQNLEKKFSEQKKSSDTFESKEKSYQNEINKREQQIKRLQSIIMNNKETIVSLEQTISYFKKNNEFTGTKTTNNTQSDSVIEQLKRQNDTLKEKLNRQRKISIPFSNENTSIYQLKIKQLEKSLTQSSKEIQSKQTQINSLRQSYSTLHQSYKNQFNQHQNTKSQLRKFKDNSQELTKNLTIKTQKIQQLNNQLVYLQQKYQASLEKLLTQNQLFEKQKSSYQNIIKILKIEKQTLAQSQEKIKSQLHQLQNDISFKSIQIETLQDKFINVSEQQDNISKQKLYQNDFQEISQQLKRKQQQLKLREENIQQLSSELKKKTLLVEEIACEKIQLLAKIQTFQTKIQKLESQGRNKGSQKRSKKTSDSVEIKDHFTISNSQLNDQKESSQLLSLYHEKYSQIVNLFNLLEQNQQTKISSITQVSQQNEQNQKITKSLPSKQYLDHFHNLITDQIKKIFKDLKKLILALKQCQTESQLKNQRLYELDKTLKKQGNKIGSLITQIHMKNAAIADINKMQLQKEIFRLNQKYQILNQITF